MRKLDLKEKCFSIESIPFLEAFEFVSNRFLDCLHSNSIRGFLSTVGNCNCSCFAASVFEYFYKRPNCYVLVLSIGRKVGDTKELNYFVVYYLGNRILVHFRNRYGSFVDVEIYHDGDYSVHFLK